MKDPEVLSVSAASNTPDNIGNNADNIWWEGKSPEMKTLVSMAGIDFDYIETAGIKLKSGRSFSREYSIDIPHDSSGTFLINEQLEKLMGTVDATGKQLRFGGTRGQIVGVMKDFNFESLHSRVGPLALWIWPQKFFGFIFIRIKPGDMKGSLTALENTWKRIMPDNPFDYHFLDEQINASYLAEEQSGALVRNFSILAIFIACIGLFGLATYTVERKMREVGIRKALGASSPSIFYLIGGEFLKLLVIAIMVSVPVSIVMMHRYLGNYGYHINLGAGIFIVGIFFVFTTAALAVGYQLVYAARTNPAISLKYE
jgi:putative ABC transport system permease protein